MDSYGNLYTGIIAFFIALVALGIALIAYYRNISPLPPPPITILQVGGNSVIEQQIQTLEPSQTQLVRFAVTSTTIDTDNIYISAVSEARVKRSGIYLLSYKIAGFVDEGGDTSSRLSNILVNGIPIDNYRITSTRVPSLLQGSYTRAVLLNNLDYISIELINTNRIFNIDTTLSSLTLQYIRPPP